MRVVDPSLPKVGAVCGKAARTVLCGGRSAMSVPTAMAATIHLAARRRGGGITRLRRSYDPVRLPPELSPASDAEAATLAHVGSPPITRTTFPTCGAH